MVSVWRYAKSCISTWAPLMRPSSSGKIRSCAVSLLLSGSAEIGPWRVLLAAKPLATDFAV
jgi:hypothetical protein